MSVVVAVGAAGLAIDRWRQGNPELVAYIETLDRPAAPAAPREPVARRASALESDAPRPGEPVVHGAAARHGSTRGRHARADDATPLDVNLASAADFARLPGVGPALAARIVDIRAREGPFGSVDDLRRVRGVGDATLERVRSRLAVNTP